MADIRPLSAVRYRARRGSDISTLISPPYDVLDQSDKDRLLARDPHNFVGLDLPHVPPKSAGPPEAYQHSATLLANWLSSGVMIRESTAALYPYRQRFEHRGRQHVRRGLIGRVRLEEFGAGCIHPHEQTFGGPKADRLELTRATCCNLSPIFGLYRDPGNQITDGLYAGLSEPETSGRINGIDHQLWVVTDQEKISKASAQFSSKDIYIADGHHRYTTSLNYRAWLADQGESIAADHPANFVTFVLISMDDPGLLILPTHRCISGLENFQIEQFRAGLDSCIRIEEVPHKPNPGDNLDTLLSGDGIVYGLYDGASGRLYRLEVPVGHDPLESLQAGRSRHWRKMDVAVLHHYIIEEVLKPRFGCGNEPAVHYMHNAEEALNKCESGQSNVAFLLRPTPMAVVEQIATGGELMPQKSTFFYPKVASGLVINPLS